MDIVTPEDFGAAGDGTADDTIPVQAALDSGHGAVAFVGAYLTGQLIARAAKQSLIGMGGQLLAMDGSIVNSSHLQITGAGVTVQGLRLQDPFLQGNLPAAAIGGRSYGIEILADQVTISGCYVDQYQTGIAQRAGSGSIEYKGAVIVGNQITNVLGAGLAGGSYGEDRGDGIVCWGRGNTVNGNLVTCADGNDARVGIHFEALSGSNTSPDVYKDKLGVISGNTVIGHFRRAITDEGVNNVSITGNSVAGNSWWGINIVEADNVVVSGNSILFDRSANDNSGSAWSPIQAPLVVWATAQSRDVLLEANIIEISGSCVAAVLVNGPIQNPVVRNNHFSLTGTGSATNAVQINGNASGIEIVENDFPTAAGTAIYVASSASISRISRNAFSGSAGITRASSSMRVDGNSITITGSGYVLDVGTSTGVVFEKNVVTLLGASVAAIRSSAGFQCARNVFTLSAAAPASGQACVRFSAAPIRSAGFEQNRIVSQGGSLAHRGVWSDGVTSELLSIADNIVEGNGAQFSLLYFSSSVTGLTMQGNRMSSSSGYQIQRAGGVEIGPWQVSSNQNGDIAISRDPNALANLSASYFNARGARLRYLLPTGGGGEGLICISSGAPGTLKEYGVISS